MSYSYWTDGTDTGIQMRATDKGRVDSLIAMVQGDHRDSIVMDDALRCIPSVGARHRVLAGYGMSADQYREAFTGEKLSDTISLYRLDAFTEGYLECALWSSTDNADDSGGEPLDANYGFDDIHPASLARMVEDCREFQETHADLLAATEASDEQNGHDFWLTRNRHGTGFWDRGYPKGVGDELTAAALDCRSVDLIVGDDDEIHQG